MVIHEQWEGAEREFMLEKTREGTTVNTVIVSISVQDLLNQALPIADADVTRLFRPYRKSRGTAGGAVMRRHADAL